MDSPGVEDEFAWRPPTARIGGTHVVGDTGQLANSAHLHLSNQYGHDRSRRERGDLFLGLEKSGSIRGASYFPKRPTWHRIGFDGSRPGRMASTARQLVAAERILKVRTI